MPWIQVFVTTHIYVTMDFVWRDNTNEMTLLDQTIAWVFQSKVILRVSLSIVVNSEP